MKRIVPGVLIAAFWLLLLLFGSAQIFSLVLFVAVLVAADEYGNMADSRSRSAGQRVGLNLIMAVPVAAVWLLPQPHMLLFGAICSFGLLSCYFLYTYRTLPDCYDLFTKHLFGLFYIGVLGAHLILLRELPDGASWLIIASVITGGSDTGAYYVGRRFGRKKLCPNISPNKTIEGAVGGMICGMLAAVVFGAMLLTSFDLIFTAVVAAVLSLVGIAGDLTESIIKRGTGTKDSGKCLAGHGGLLDRVDSLLFVAPVLYYILVFLVVQ